MLCIGNMRVVALVIAGLVLAAGVPGGTALARDNGCRWGCPWANDGACGGSGSGAGGCAAGTGTADCRPVQLAGKPNAAPGPNSCQTAFDKRCDEPGIGTGRCAAGTDSADCRPGGRDPGPPSPPAAVPPPAGPGRPGTAAGCMWPNDGQCDEPGIGTGLCPAGTDPDCRR